MVRVFVIAQSAARAQRIRSVLSLDHEIDTVRLSFDDDEFMSQLSTSNAQIVALDAACGPADVHRMTQEIMHKHPVPVVILAERSADQAGTRSIQALEDGALTVLELPPESDHGGASSTGAGELCRNLRLMSEVKVVRRWDSTRFESFQRIMHPAQENAESRPPVHIVAIGASAGGTQALQQVFGGIHETFPVPILVVQHIAKGYITGLTRWLDEQTPLRVRIAENGTIPEAGTVYLAPDDAHLTVDSDRRILLLHDAPVNGFRPSIARLFQSVADEYQSNAAAVLLSGMGNDGAAEMRTLFDHGACTIAQDKRTSLIHGIPGEAIKLRAARFILPLPEIGSALETVAGGIRNAHRISGDA
mgnify:CR=1 FL=1